MQHFLEALLVFAVMFYTQKAGPSWFLSLCEVAWVLRGLPAIFYVILAFLLGLCYNCVFVFYYFGWIRMLYWETSLYFPCIEVTLGVTCLP